MPIFAILIGIVVGLGSVVFRGVVAFFQRSRFAYVASYEKLKYEFHLSSFVEITPLFNIEPGADVVCLVKINTDEL